MEITTGQLDILRHAAKSPRGVFCGDPPGMAGLVAAGLMKSRGRVSWCPDEYFGVTNAGRAYLRDVADAERAAKAGKAG